MVAGTGKVASVVRPKYQYISTVRSTLWVGWIKRPLLRIHALAAFVHPAQHSESTGLGVRAATRPGVRNGRWIRRVAA